VTTLYIVEKDKGDLLGAAKALMGDYAVRAFASLNALKHLTKILGHMMPDVVLADLDDLMISPSEIIRFLSAALPDSSIILLTSQAISVPEISGRSPDTSRIFVYSKPIDSLDLSGYVALIAKDRGNRSNLIRVRDVILDLTRLQCQVLPDETPISLPLKEAQILKILMERPGECLSREDLHKSIWPGMKVSARNIDSHISRLRKRLKAASFDIVSKYGGGYVLQISG
jgi:DNA-binding response OmpR family regulator